MAQKAKPKARPVDHGGKPATSGSLPMDMVELRKIFDQFDTDGNGTLELSELKHATQALGVSCTDNSAKKVFKLIDADSSGMIDWIEFQEFFRRVSDQDQLKSLLSEHNKRFFDYKYRVRTDPNILHEFVVPPSAPKATCLSGHDNDVISVRWISQEEFASASIDGSLSFWSATETVPEKKLKKRHKTSSHGIYCMDAILGGQALLIGMGSDSDNLWLWDLETSEVSKQLKGHTKPVHSCNLSPSFNYSASGDRVGNLLVHDIESGGILNKWESLHENVICSSTFNNSETLICTASRDGHVKIVDLKVQGFALATIEDAATSGVVFGALWCKDNEILACGDDYCIKRWDIRKPNDPPVSCYLGHTSAVRAIAISPDADYMISGAQDGAVRLWEVDRAGKMQQKLMPRREKSYKDLEAIQRKYDAYQTKLHEGEGDIDAFREMGQQLEAIRKDTQAIDNALAQNTKSEYSQACLDMESHKSAVLCCAWLDQGDSIGVLTSGSDQMVHQSNIPRSAFINDEE